MIMVVHIRHLVNMLELGNRVQCSTKASGIHTCLHMAGTRYGCQHTSETRLTIEEFGGKR